MARTLSARCLSDSRAASEVKCSRRRLFWPDKVKQSINGLRLVDHNIGGVPAGELRLVVATTALLVCHTIGDDRRAIGRKRIHP